MFTGIVETTGRVLGVAPTQAGVRLALDAGAAAEGVTLGESIAVSGVCLTACHIQANTLEFDVIRETLERSTLGRLRAGDRVNLERSLRVGDRLDGHFVQGHVDGRAQVRRRTAPAREFVLWLAPEPALLPYIIPKGAIAIDGVSLTIAELRGREFSVALIPTTLERTTLADRRESDWVNIETDMLVRAVVHRLEAMETGRELTVETLTQAGFA